MKLIEDVQLDLGAAAAIAGTSDVDSSIIDMAGYEGVIVFASLAVQAANNYLQATHGDTTSPAETVTGSKVITDSTNDVAILEIHRPQKRYFKFTLKRGTSTASGDMYVVRYGARRLPKNNDVANTTNVVTLHAPVTGTP